MTENADTAKQSVDDGTALGEVTEFVSILMQHDKGRAQVEASKALDECVQAALNTGKKGGKVTVAVAVEPLESGAVKLLVTVDSRPVKDPAGSVWFADGDGKLSRDNAGLFYAR